MFPRLEPDSSESTAVHYNLKKKIRLDNVIKAVPRGFHENSLKYREDPRFALFYCSKISTSTLATPLLRDLKSEFWKAVAGAKRWMSARNRHLAGARTVRRLSNQLSQNFHSQICHVALVATRNPHFLSPIPLPMLNRPRISRISSPKPGKSCPFWTGARVQLYAPSDMELTPSSCGWFSFSTLNYASRANSLFSKNRTELENPTSESSNRIRGDIWTNSYKFWQKLAVLHLTECSRLERSVDDSRFVEENCKNIREQSSGVTWLCAHPKIGSLGMQPARSGFRSDPTSSLCGKIFLKLLTFAFLCHWNLSIESGKKEGKWALDSKSASWCGLFQAKHLPKWVIGWTRLSEWQLASPSGSEGSVRREVIARGLTRRNIPEDVIRSEWKRLGNVFEYENVVGLGNWLGSAEEYFRVSRRLGGKLPNSACNLNQKLIEMKCILSRFGRNCRNRSFAVLSLELSEWHESDQPNRTTELTWEILATESTRFAEIATICRTPSAKSPPSSRINAIIFYIERDFYLWLNDATSFTLSVWMNDSFLTFL